MAVGFDELYKRAKAVTRPRRLSDRAEAGEVGAALVTGSGRVYTGTCIDTAGSMGFCAEHAAAAAMVAAGESRVVRMIAVSVILPAWNLPRNHPGWLLRRTQSSGHSCPGCRESGRERCDTAG